MTRSTRSRSRLLHGCLLASLLTVSAHTVSAQLTESFGKAGAIRIFQGQIRDGLDQPVSSADITITDVLSKKSYELTTDEYGVFRKHLPTGEYEVRVHGMGFNPAEYTVKVVPSAKKLYLITRLSPGCGSGNSGVALVKRLKDRSFTDEN